MQKYSTATKIPYAADVIIKKLIEGITTIKHDFITGVYLTGSVALNDFYPGKSDIDFLILCKQLPTGETTLQLKRLHRLIERRFKKWQLNGSYITNEALNVHNCQTTKTLSFHEGQLNESAFEMAPVTLFELKTTSITLHGIPANELPVVVEPKDVNDFLSTNINTYWKNWVTRHSSLIQRKLLLLLLPGLTEWVILGVARQLYTLRKAKIVSKTDAGYYCLDLLPPRYHCIVQQAINIRQNQSKHFLTLKSSYYVRPSLKRLAQTIDCARYMIQRFNKEYTELGNKADEAICKSQV